LQNTTTHVTLTDDSTWSVSTVVQLIGPSGGS